MAAKVSWEPPVDDPGLDEILDERGRMLGTPPPVSALSDERVKEEYEAILRGERSEAPRRWISVLMKRARELGVGG